MSTRILVLNIWRILEALVAIASSAVTGVARAFAANAICLTSAPMGPNSII
jgi:hypothetical protein